MLKSNDTLFIVRIDTAPGKITSAYSDFIWIKLSFALELISHTAQWSWCMCDVGLLANTKSCESGTSLHHKVYSKYSLNFIVENGNIWYWSA